MAQQVVAGPQEQIRQVAQEVDEAPGCCCHVGCREGVKKEAKVLRYKLRFALPYSETRAVVFFHLEGPISVIDGQ